MADKTAGQLIAERYFLDEEEAVALAKDIDSAITNAMNLENEACAKLLDTELEPWYDKMTRGLVPQLLKGLAEQVRNRSKT